MRLPRSLKRFVRDVVESVILNIDRAEVKAQGDEGQVVVNMPIALAISKAEAKSEASAEAEVLKAEVRILKKKLQLCREELKLQSGSQELKQLRERLNYVLKKLREIYYYPRDSIPKSLIYKILKEVGGV